MTNALIAAKNTAIAHMTNKSTDELFEMLDLADDRTVSAWIAEAIEIRHPEVTEAMEAWSEDMETTETYNEALRRAVK